MCMILIDNGLITHLREIECMICGWIGFDSVLVCPDCGNDDFLDSEELCQAKKPYDFGVRSTGAGGWVSKILTLIGRKLR